MSEAGVVFRDLVLGGIRHLRETNYNCSAPRDCVCKCCVQVYVRPFHENKCTILNFQFLGAGEATKIMLEDAHRNNCGERA